MSKIIYVNSGVLCYKSELDAEILIDLKNCNENWIKYKHHMNFRDKSPDAIVGQRDICSNPCFIEFFTRPFTRITFDGQDANDRFKHWNNELKKAGWNTIDLS